MEIANMLKEAVNFIKNIFSGFISHIILAVIILLSGFILGRLAGRLIKRGLHEIELDGIIRKTTSLKYSAEDILSTVIAYFIYFITVIMALNQLGVTTTILYIIAGAIIVLVVLSVFLGIKDFIPNLMAGIFIHEKRNISQGDYIKFKDIEGQVVHINLIETKIKTKKGDIIIIPNANLTKSEIIKLRKKISKPSREG